MKKNISIFCVSFLLIIVTFSFTVCASEVHINGEPVNIQCIETDGGKYLPVRAIAEAIGYSVFYNDSNGMICISKGKNSKNDYGRNDIVIFSTNSPGLTVWKSEQNRFEKIETMGEQPVVENGVTYMQSYYLLRALDLTNSMTEDKLYIYTVDYQRELFQKE